MFKTSRGGILTESLSARGQSLVEFALVLPMLLVFLLGVADFGRVFTAGITIEAAARNGAEAAAQEYLQVSKKSGGVLNAADYLALHKVARDRVCADSQPLPNKIVSGGNCTMPVIAVCIHDGGGDLGCGSERDPSMAGCTAINDVASWNKDKVGPSLGSPPTALPYVEVRVCYQFTTLFNLGSMKLPFGWSISLGDVWLQRERDFTVANY